MHCSYIAGSLSSQLFRGDELNLCEVKSRTFLTKFKGELIFIYFEADGL